MSTPTPIAPAPNFEQNGAMLLTVAAINAAGSTPAEKLAAALAAQSVASIFTAAATGSVATINTEVAALAGSITDPGLALVVQQLSTAGGPYLQVLLTTNAGLPLIGASVQAILTSVAAGMNQAAQAYITAYSTPPVAKPA